MISQGTPWSSKITSSSRSPGDAEPRETWLAHDVTWKNHYKAEINLPQGGRAGTIWRLDGCRDSERLTGEGGGVIVVIWYGRVSLGVCVVVVSNSTVERGNVAPVIQGPINDTGEEPLGSC